MGILKITDRWSAVGEEYGETLTFDNGPDLVGEIHYFEDVISRVRYVLSDDPTPNERDWNIRGIDDIRLYVAENGFLVAKAEDDKIGVPEALIVPVPLMDTNDEYIHLLLESIHLSRRRVVNLSMSEPIDLF